MEKSNQAPLNPQILVVDDELDMCCMMANYLKRVGYKVDMACNAEDAYSMFEDVQYQAVVSDIKMPGEDGISLLTRIHANWPDAPVILMADLNDVQLMHAAIKHGAFDSIQKPPDFVHLEKIVERAVKFSKLQLVEKNYHAAVEEAVVERALESERAAARLRAELAERDAAEERMRAENAERQKQESSQQKQAAERAAELQSAVEKLSAEIAERKATEEKLEQERKAAEEKLKQEKAAAEAANEKLKAELDAERRKAEAGVEQLKSEIVERQQLESSLQQSSSERALQLQATIEQLQSHTQCHAHTHAHTTHAHARTHNTHIQHSRFAPLHIPSLQKPAP